MSIVVGKDVIYNTGIKKINCREMVVQKVEPKQYNGSVWKYISVA